MKHSVISMYGPITIKPEWDEYRAEWCYLVRFIKWRIGCFCQYGYLHTPTEMDIKSDTGYRCVFDKTRIANDGYYSYSRRTRYHTKKEAKEAVKCWKRIRGKMRDIPDEEYV